MTVLVLAPHPDDEALGPGGTIAKLASEGERVVVVIFSLGETGVFWQKEADAQETRRQEGIRAGKILGSARTIFLGLKDTAIRTDIVEKDIETRVAEIIREEKPRMILTVSKDDLYPDHQAVHNFSLAIHDSLELDIPVWSYTVWNPLHFTSRHRPRLVIDVTEHFKKKWKAIHAHESQKISTYQLIPTVMLRGFMHGLRHGYRMAEVFVQVR